MSVKDILVHVDTSLPSDSRLWLADQLASRFNAYLIGVGVDEDAPCLAAAKEKFTKLLQRDGLQGEWHMAMGGGAGYVARWARDADLVILGQPDPAHPTGLDAPEDVILACGRPALVIPYSGRLGRTGEYVLIAWNGSREATRAAHDALPLMAISKSVTVFSVNPDDEKDEAPGDDLIRHFARHGVDATSETLRTEELSPAEAVLSRAADVGADLIVMGAYSHSRLRETVLGGMTRDILKHMTVPVLMAH